MNLLNFLIFLFFLNTALGIVYSIWTHRILKVNGLRIERKSIRMAYTTKELSQLFKQTDSKKLHTEIQRLILLNKISTWSSGIYIAVFLIIALIAYVL